MELTIDVTDWAEEYRAIEPDVSKNPIIDLQLKKGMKPAQVARLLIIARQRGDVAADLFPADKLLLMTGGAVHVSSYTAMQKAKVEVNGKTFEARAYVAPVGEEEEDDYSANDTQYQGVTSSPDPLVNVKGEAALDYAQKYLTVKVPGYIWGRLLIVAANEGDVAQTAQQLKDEIDRMVKALE